MKLKNITLVGFRGFNEKRSIPIHDRLTLIAAPNSHGKTSISEGFEWLLYGFTSKVALAESKDEYRGPYRNIHFLEPQAPTVTVTIAQGASTSELQATLSGSEAVLRVDGKVVAAWPFSDVLQRAPKPFILQHALKDLLLAAPVERFNRFAALLGFDELTQVHKDLMAFCTKPPVPSAAKTLIAEIDALTLRVEANAQLAPIAKSMKKGLAHLPNTRSLINKCVRRLVSTQRSDQDLLPELLKGRDEAISKVFSGTVAVTAFTAEEIAVLQAEESRLLNLAASEALRLFTEIGRQVAQQKILREAEFYELGVELLRQTPSVCPFCAQNLSQADLNHIGQHHANVLEKKQSSSELEQVKAKLSTLLWDLGQDISEYYKKTAGRTKAILDTRDKLPKLTVLLMAEHERHLYVISTAIEEIDVAVATFVEMGKALRLALVAAQTAATQVTAQLTVVEHLGKALVPYLAAGRTVRDIVTKHAPGLELAQKVLTEQLTKTAGTATTNLAIELLENDRKIEKRMQVGAMVDGLKLLKSEVDEFVTKMMLDSISGELAGDVMQWYKRIRTIGDPDVHFAGFDMKKTSQGGRVQIKASSYGKELVSAVSSLSESKLNALGLCISIAINVKEISPFEFLIIDDPIQSWDKDHELQFINVVRELVERGKQVVLLSHNGEWIKQVRATCADLNGFYYEITGYTDLGPNVTLLPWVEPKQRMQTILAIVEDQGADSVRLQQAEEELRQVLHQYTCMLYEGVKGTPKNPGTLNASKVRKMLTECGLALPLINQVMTIFETSDDAHHAAPGYSPNRQKLRQYYQTAILLSQAVGEKINAEKAISIVIPGKTA